MVDELTPLVERVAQWPLTYWLHSTLLLGLAALGFVLVQRFATRRCGRFFESHALWERVWKFSAIAGVITTSLQMTFGTGFYLVPDRLFSSPDDSVVPGSPGRLARIPATQLDTHAHREMDGIAELQRVLDQLETLDSSFAVERQPTADSVPGLTRPVGGEPESTQALNAAFVQSVQPLSAVTSRSPVGSDEVERTSESNTTSSPRPTGLAAAIPVSRDRVLSPACLLGWLVCGWLSGSLVLLWIQTRRFQHLVRDA